MRGEFRFRPPLARGLSATFAEFHSGKKGVTINLKKKRSIEIFKGLVKHSDVVLENYSTGTMDRLGIGYQTLREINPRIIFASITGFGQYGPWARRPSFDILGQATSGFMSVMGESIDPEGPPILVPEAPQRLRSRDLLCPRHHRRPLLEAVLRSRPEDRGRPARRDDVITPSIAMYMLTGMTGPQRRRRIGSDIPGVYGTFKARDGYVAIAAPMGPAFNRSVRSFGGASVDRAFIEGWVSGKTVDQVADKLVEADVPVSPVFGIPEVVEDRHALARDMIVEVEHPEAGKVKVVGIPMEFSESKCRVENPPPLLGQHNKQILKELLGCSEEEIDELKREGVI